MGGNRFSCLASNCAADPGQEFSEVLSISNEEEYHGGALLSSKIESNIGARLLQHASVHGTQHVATEAPTNNSLPSPAVEGDARSPSTVRDFFSEDGGSVDTGPSSSDNKSHESVLSTISPTKDRKRAPPLSPQKRFQKASGANASAKIDKLYLHGAESEVVDDWTELHALIKAGKCAPLRTYVKEHDVDLPTVRFTEHLYSTLHLAVLYDHLEIVQYLLHQGVNVNVKDESGYTAMGIAYEQSSLEVINELFNAKAQEFASSPYSPYALSVASNNALSVQGSAKVAAPSPTLTSSNLADQLKARADAQGDSPEILDNVSVRSDPASAWSTPRSRTDSADNMFYRPQRRFTLNTPSSAFRSSPIVVDSVKKRMTQLTESLERLSEQNRQRSFSLPANSPVFASLNEDRARSPSDPPVPMMAVLPVLDLQSVQSAQSASSAESRTSRSATGEDSSIASDLTGSNTHDSHAGKSKKPIGKRFRQAAGRALSLLNPVKGMPPRAPSVASRPPLARPGLPVHTTATAVPASVSGAGAQVEIATTAVASIVDSRQQDDSTEEGTTVESATVTESDLGTTDEAAEPTNSAAESTALRLESPAEIACVAEQRLAVGCAGEDVREDVVLSLVLPTDLQSPVASRQR